MRLLPRLAFGRRLPLCDVSAAALAEALLLGARRGDAGAPALAEALAGDASLTLWVSARAAAAGAETRNLPELAAWLAENLSAALRWPADDLHRPDPDFAARRRYAESAARAVQVAEGASRMAAARRGGVSSEAAYFAGLLIAGQREFLGDDLAPAHCLWFWADEDARNGLQLLVSQAVGIVAGDSALPAEWKLKRRALDRLAADVRRRWLEPGHCAADWLPALAARLAETEELRSVQWERLETEKLESLAEFAAGAGHEMNNPLAVISGRAQLLLRDERDPERRRDLAVMHAQAMRVHEMIADVMLFARPPRPRRETQDLAPLLATLAEELSPELARRETTLSLSCPTALAIDVDRGQLLIALRALCENSLQAIGRGGRIDIAAGLAGSEIEIVVRDDGPGIPPEVRRHLFDPFYSGRASGRGLGNGLSKCWRIVAQHGGRMEVAAASPGTAFTIRLPPPIAPTVTDQNAV